MSFLFVDRILSLIPGKQITGIKHITQYDLYWQKMDKDQPFSFASTIIGETLGQLAAWNAMFSLDFTHRPVAGVVDGVEILGDAHIGDTLFLSATIEKLDLEQVVYHGEVTVLGKPILKLHNALGPMLPMQTFCQEALVKRQFESLYRPGEMQEASPLDRIEKVPVHKVPLTYDAKNIDSNSGVIQAMMLVSKSAPFFPDHFPDNPVLPMTLLLNANIDLATELLQTVHGFKYSRPVAIEKVKMKAFVRPGDTIFSQVRLIKQNENKCQCEIITRLNGQKICVAKVMFEVELT